MSSTLPKTREEYLADILKEPEIGERKLRKRYAELFAYIDTIESPSNFVERLYLFLHNVTPICAVPGCGKLTKFEDFKTGYRTCCSYKCSTQYLRRGFNTKEKIKERVDQAIIDQAAFDAEIQRKIEAGSELCAGCGAVARFYSPQNDRWRCVERVQECPATLAKMGQNISAALIGVSREDTATKIEPVAGQLCHYGCGQLAQYRLTESCEFKLSCSAAHQACPAQRERRSNFMTEKYKDPVVRQQFFDRLNATNQQRHGVNWASQILDYQQKAGDTLEAKWGPGIRHNSLIPHLREENVKRLLTIGFTNKEYICPSGKTVRIQGYEDMALNDLLKIFEEDEIRTANDGLEPKFPRFEYLFNCRPLFNHYYPDILIPSVNTIIEVKGTFTYVESGNWYQNKLKEKAVLDAGYNFLWFVYKGRNKDLYSLDELAEIDARQLKLLRK